MYHFIRGIIDVQCTVSLSAIISQGLIAKLSLSPRPLLYFTRGGSQWLMVISPVSDVRCVVGVGIVPAAQGTS